MPAKHRAPSDTQANHPDREHRSWRWYVDEASGSNPIELVRALGLSTASQTTLQADLYEQIYEALLIDELQHLATELDASPTPNDMQTFGEYPPAEYVHLFGSWTAALTTADIPTHHEAITQPPAHSGRVRVERFPPWLPTPISEEELLEGLREFATTIGAIPTAVDMQKFGRFAVKDYIQQFGSWENALDQAELTRPARSRETVEPGRLAFTPIAQQARADHSDRELLAELRRLAAEIGMTPTPTDMEKFGAFAPQQYLDQFGDWETALTAASLASPETHNDGRAAITKIRHILTGFIAWSRGLLE